MHQFNRRNALQLLTGSIAGASVSGWFPLLARAAAENIERPRSCILLWMPGGPSQLDTFDPKPEHENGGEFAAIETSVPGIRISEHFPQLARQAEHLAIIRSMKTKEGDHGRATYHLRTGYRPGGPIQHPVLGSLISNERPPNPAALPNYISILPNSFPGLTAGPGFLGPQHAPLMVGSERESGNSADSEYGAPLEVRNTQFPEGVQIPRARSRMDLLEFVDQRFAENRPGLPTQSHQSAYRQAAQLMESPAMKAFDLDTEPATLREAYGKNRFGQACLLARRLVEQGVPFIEIALSGPGGGVGWDTHQENFSRIKDLSATLDPAWATLLADLDQRGLLATTTVVWMGEFGRTPTINNMGGRDHFPNAWSTVLAGAGIQGGQVYGATSESGQEVTDNPVAVNEFMATLLASLGIDHTRQNLSGLGRPIRLVEPDVTPIGALLREG